VKRNARFFTAFLLVGALIGRAGAEPPIVEETNALGTKYHSQTFDGGSVSSRYPQQSIAERYYAAGDLKESVAAFDAPISCAIREDGIVLMPTCAERAELPQSQHLVLAALLKFGELQNLPHYSATDKLLLLRRVNLVVHVEQFDALPQLDLTSGQLAPLQQVAALGEAIRSGRAGLDYPPAALRSEVQGVLTLECQVQADLSVICHEELFNPPGLGHYFIGMAKRAFLKVRVGPKLASGEDARGVRIRLPISLP
jgi:hypothetical protein